MNRITIALLLCLCSLHSFSQEVRNDSVENIKPVRIPAYHISISTGFNNTVGYCGVSLEKPIVKSGSLEFGAGMSYWGLKLNGGWKKYFNGYKGWALAAGATFNTGLKDQTVRYSGGRGSSTKVDFLPQVNIYVSFYHDWRIAKRFRLFTDLGWSFALTSQKFSDRNAETTLNGEDIIKWYAPGGFMLCLGGSYTVFKK